MSKNDVGIAKMRKVAVDIANYCMFSYHNYPESEYQE